ncbi:MAG: hypothetical protein ACI92A_002706, partial [Candidatus Paceibacteria bacterium]
GYGEWDRPGGDLEDKAGLAAFLDEMRANIPSNVVAHELDCHINDDEFAAKALQVFDGWLADGTVQV